MLDERGLSGRWLAREIRVSQPYLLRVLAGSGSLAVRADIALRVARALGLPEDYFPEWRVLAIVQRMQSDPAFRDSVYKKLGARKEGKSVGRPR